MTSQMDQDTRERVATPDVPKDIDVADYPKGLTANVYSLKTMQLEKRKPGRPKISPACQVIGCNADLSGLRTYYKRYHICTDHCSASSIPLSILPPLQTRPFLTSHDPNTNTTAQVRFCQQCASWHSLDKFKGNRKSCINSLCKIKQRHKVKLERTMNSQLQGHGGQQEQSKVIRKNKKSAEATDISGEAASGKSFEFKYVSNVQGESHNSSSCCTKQNRSNVQHSTCCDDGDDGGSHEYSQYHQVINQTDLMDGVGHAMSLFTEQYLDTYLFDAVGGGSSSLFMEEDRVGEGVPMLAVPLPSIPLVDPVQPLISSVSPTVFKGVPNDLSQDDEARLLPPVETAFMGWVKL